MSIIVSSDFLASLQEQEAQPQRHKAQDNGHRNPNCQVHSEFLLQYSFLKNVVQPIDAQAPDTNSDIDSVAKIPVR